MKRILITLIVLAALMVAGCGIMNGDVTAKQVVVASTFLPDDCSLHATHSVLYGWWISIAPSLESSSAAYDAVDEARGTHFYGADSFEVAFMKALARYQSNIKLIGDKQ